MNFRESLKKIQELPLQWRKAILWTIVAILGIILALFWLDSSKKRLENINPGDTIKQLIPPVNQQNLQNENNP